MSGLTPLNFLFNLTGSHVMHFSSFAGAGVGDLGCAGAQGLVSPSRGCSGWCREPSVGLAQTRPGREKQGQFRAKHSWLVILRDCASPGDRAVGHLCHS